MKWFDRFRSLMFRLMKPNRPKDIFSSCGSCEKYIRNWPKYIADKMPIDGYCVGYDEMLHEYWHFMEDDQTMKLLVMAKEITSVVALNKDLWMKIKGLCRRCISKELKTPKNP